MLNTIIVHKTHLDILFKYNVRIFKKERYNDEFIKIYIAEDETNIVKAFFAGIQYASENNYKTNKKN